ncbi:T9SS type A sorting domain-containing protein [Pontibacter sp. G13]|uniref:T9SS type A sorting domain-containing protein n=1 Tax=Pontibacter sp. G13 TaxID=3074898 RepID=UPI002889C3E6|nr:T9SS type A sorting domain-containing protein [Pontibacter sp. G13]WNJ18671.1 T9SS type A sorting domain-containing protein [Pontibacter sp. G13]
MDHLKKFATIACFLLSFIAGTMPSLHAVDVSSFSEFKTACEDPQVDTVRIVGDFTATSKVLVNRIQSGTKFILASGPRTITITNNATFLEIQARNLVLQGTASQTLNVEVNSTSANKTLNVIVLNGTVHQTIEIRHLVISGEYNRAIYAGERRINGTLSDQDLGPMELLVQHTSISGFRQKGIVINRKGVQAYTSHARVEISDCSFSPSLNARSDGQHRAISFDAGNDGGACGRGCSQVSQQGIQAAPGPKVTVGNGGLKLYGNHFHNSGVAFANYGSVIIGGDTSQSNDFLIDANVIYSGTYKCINVENQSSDVTIVNNQFDIQAEKCRILFLGAGSEWIIDTNDHLFPAEQITFEDNFLVANSNQVLDYVYSRGVKSVEIEGNNFNGVMTQNVPFLFDYVHPTEKATSERMAEEIVMGPNMGVATPVLSCGKSWKLIIYASICNNSIDEGTFPDPLSYIGWQRNGPCVLDPELQKCIDQVSSWTAHQHAPIYAFPNPVTDGILRLEVQDAQMLSVEILNLQGQLLGSFPLRKRPEIDLRGLASGMYFAKIHTRTGVELLRFTIAE